MDRLEGIGFKKVGEWLLENGLPKHVLHIEANSKNILYAFVSKQEILYIGKTVRSLKQRMSGYQNPGPTQSTNIKGNYLILEFLKSGGTIDIYALPDNGLLHYGGFHINLAAGLEDSLVSKIKPKWNKMGVSSD